LPHLNDGHGLLLMEDGRLGILWLVELHSALDLGCLEEVVLPLAHNCALVKRLLLGLGVLSPEEFIIYSKDWKYHRGLVAAALHC
jgi:hypothetical protein